MGNYLTDSFYSPSAARDHSGNALPAETAKLGSGRRGAPALWKGKEQGGSASSSTAAAGHGRRGSRRAIRCVHHRASPLLIQIERATSDTDDSSLLQDIADYSEYDPTSDVDGDPSVICSSSESEPENVPDSEPEACESGEDAPPRVRARSLLTPARRDPIC